MDIRRLLARAANYLLESSRPRSVQMGYQPKTTFSGGMYGTYSSSLDDVLVTGEKLRKTREEILRTYGDNVVISIHLEHTGSEHKPIFRVYLGETKEGNLKPALRDFLTSAGEPSAAYTDFTFPSARGTELVKEILKANKTPKLA